MPRLRTIAFAMLLLLPAPAGAFPLIPGWEQTSGTSVFGPDDLWKYINGAADHYLAYGFHELQAAEISFDSVTVALNIYNMGSRLNAFGLYQLEAPAEAEQLAFGTRAVNLPPYQALLLIDSLYIKLEVYEGELNAASGRALLSAVSAAIPCDRQLPRELAALSERDRSAGSEAFTKRGYMGLAELVDVLHADYHKPGGGTYSIFCLISVDGEASANTWTRLAGKWQRDVQGGVLYREIPFRGTIAVARTETGILGVANIGSRETTLAHLRKLTAAP